jgi:hypothetical protein
MNTATKAKQIFNESKMKDEVVEALGGQLRKRLPSPASQETPATKSVKEELEDLKKTGFVSLQGKVMQEFKQKTERMTGQELKEVVTEEPTEEPPKED